MRVYFSSVWAGGALPAGGVWAGRQSERGVEEREGASLFPRGAAGMKFTAFS